MKPLLIAALGAALATSLLPTDASAQGRSRGYGPVDSYAQSSRGVAPQANGNRGSERIGARTPNASGNLGGPSTGGASGGGG